MRILWTINTDLFLVVKPHHGKDLARGGTSEPGPGPIQGGPPGQQQPGGDRVGGHDTHTCPPRGHMSCCQVRGWDYLAYLIFLFVEKYISNILSLIKYNSSSMTPTCFPATPIVTKWRRVLIFVHGVMLTSQQICDWKRKRLCKCVMDDGGRVSFAGRFVGCLWVGWYKSPTLILQTFFTFKKKKF